MTRSFALLYGISALVALFSLLPLAIPFALSFADQPVMSFPPHGFTLRWYLQVITDPDVLASFWLSLRLAATATAISLVLGTMSAVALARQTRTARRVLQTFLVAPLLFPALVTGIALLQFFSTLGGGWTFGHMVIGHVVITLPFVVRSIGTSLEMADRQVHEAARTLGAAPFAAFRLVTVPQIQPGLLAGGIMSFVISFDNYSVSMWLMDSRHVPIPVTVIDYITRFFDPSVAALSSLVVGFAALMILLVERTLGLRRLMGIESQSG